MILRKANKQDVPVLKCWDTKPHVIAAKGGDIDEFDWRKEISRHVAWREILIAENKDTPIGLVMVIDPNHEETHYWGEIEPNLRALDIWIGEETNLHRGYGTKMMNLALERCFGNAEVEAVIIDPLATNTKAIRFYKRLGFQFVEHRTFGQDDCKVYRLDRSNWLKSKHRITQ